MEINGVSRSVPAVPVVLADVRDERAAENREIVRAVKAVNGTEMFGQDNQLRYYRDPNTQRMVVRVVNKKTDEVVSQIPAEYLLRLAEDLQPKNKE